MTAELAFAAGFGAMGLDEVIESSATGVVPGPWPTSGTEWKSITGMANVPDSMWRFNATTVNDLLGSVQLVGSGVTLITDDEHFGYCLEFDGASADTIEAALAGTFDIGASQSGMPFAVLKFTATPASSEGVWCKRSAPGAGYEARATGTTDIFNVIDGGSGGTTVSGDYNDGVPFALCAGVARTVTGGPRSIVTSREARINVSNVTGDLTDGDKFGFGGGATGFTRNSAPMRIAFGGFLRSDASTKEIEQVHLLNLIAAAGL